MTHRSRSIATAYRARYRTDVLQIGFSPQAANIAKLATKSRQMLPTGINDYLLISGNNAYGAVPSTPYELTPRASRYPRALVGWALTTESVSHPKSLSLGLGPGRISTNFGTVSPRAITFSTTPFATRHSRCKRFLPETHAQTRLRNMAVLGFAVPVPFDTDDVHNLHHTVFAFVVSVVRQIRACRLEIR